MRKRGGQSLFEKLVWAGQAEWRGQLSQRSSPLSSEDSPSRGSCWPVLPCWALITLLPGGAYVAWAWRVFCHVATWERRRTWYQEPTLDGGSGRWSKLPQHGSRGGRHGTRGWTRVGRVRCLGVSPTQDLFSAFSEHSGTCACARRLDPGGRDGGTLSVGSSQP